MGGSTCHPAWSLPCLVAHLPGGTDRNLERGHWQRQALYILYNAGCTLVSRILIQGGMESIVRGEDSC